MIEIAMVKVAMVAMVEVAVIDMLLWLICCLSLIHI